MQYLYIKIIIPLITILISSINYSNAIRCYTCTYVSTSTISKACINDPEKVEGQKITNCNKKYCTIQRQELVDPPGFVNSFLRGCEDALYNDLVEDPTFKTFYRSCNTDLCNEGDGITFGGSGVDADGNQNAENLLVPGLPNSTNGLLIVNYYSNIMIIVIFMVFKNIYFI